MIQKIKDSDEYVLYNQITEEEKIKKYGNKDENGISFFLAKLLHARNIEKIEDVEKFLNPKWEDLSNPFDFNDMEKAVNRVIEAIIKKEKILIYSDYDTDGIPGGTILYDFFKKINYNNFVNFIPHRNKDGYGLTKENAEKIVNGNIFDDFSRSDFFDNLDYFSNIKDDNKNNKKFIPDLVITIDCGISDIEGAKILKKSGIDLIITDHHIAGNKLPKAFAIINHKVDNENYTDKNLCGAGVIFRFIQSIFIKMRKDGREEIKKMIQKIPIGWEKWLLDLVSVSTVCDMVPLIGENRIFVKYGQKVLAKTQRIGLNKMIKNAKLNKNNIKADDLGFMIGPRINASSRIDDPFLSFKALSEKSIKDGEEFADRLEKINNRRKYLIAKIMKEVWKKISNKEEEKVVVIGSRDWPLGIVGLVAGKIADKIKKPTFVWGGYEGDSKIIKGSVRSDGKISIYSLMEEVKTEFIGFGGHEMAGGFELKLDKLHTLQAKLSDKYKKAKKIENKKKIIDSKIELKDVNFQNYKDIEKLEPFGVGNQKPLFYLENIEIKNVNKFGKNKEHLELSFKDKESFLIKAITFFYKDNIPDKFLKKDFEIGQKINLIVSFELNQYNGNNSLRLKIEDII